MLKGLEAIEIYLSDCKSVIDFRIDANTYKKSYVYSHKLLMGKQPQTIGELSKSVQNFGAYSLCNLINFVDEGIPFLMTENIRHNYIDWNIKRYVDKGTHEILYKSHCKQEQVLITMAGEYLGRVAVYDKDSICSSNQAIAKVTLNNNADPYMTSTFLNSHYGQDQINRLKTITGQPNINMSLIKSLLIPAFSSEFSLKIRSMIICSSNKKQSHEDLYQKAENLLLKELDLLDFKPSTENIAIKSFSESFGDSGRLDSEYYQPKYDEIIMKLNNYSGGVNLLSKSFEIISGKTPKKYFNTGIRVIKTKNIRIPQVDVANITDHSADMLSVTKKNDLLFASMGVGSLGRISYVTDDSKNLNVDGTIKIFRARTKGKNIEVPTMLFLASRIGQEMIYKYVIGSTGIISISKHCIYELLLPNFSNDIAENTTKMVLESIRLKQQSKNLLEVAKKSVEIAIENNERVAMEYINSQKIMYECPASELIETKIHA